MTATSVYELRCSLWSRPGELLLDAELLRGGSEEVAAESSVLAVGVRVWGGAGRSRGKQLHVLGHDGAQWLAGGTPADWLDPARLPAGPVVAAWGAQVAACLAHALGDALLEELLIRRAGSPDTLVRLVFRALDNAAARVPVETLSWPVADGPVIADSSRSVSILRIPDVVHGNAGASRLGALEPGGFTRAVLIAPGAQLDHFSPQQVAEVMAPLGSPLKATGTFTQQMSVAAQNADLVLVCGHGNAADGLDLGDGSMSGVAIGNEVAGRPGTVVLAMCGSGHGGAGLDDASAALESSRHGVPLVIGFQGTQAALRHVTPFLGRLSEQMAAPIDDERGHRRVSLRQWESAIAAARRGDGATVPVVYVHPTLLAGRTPPAARAARALRMPRNPLSVSATPWYVPGQVACIREGVRLFRVPMPVDVGARVLVTVIPGGRTSEVGEGLALDAADVALLREHWPLDARLGIALSLVEEAPAATSAGWARRSAELGAVVRALTKAFNTSTPSRVAELVNDAVARDHGALGAAARLVDVTSGRSIRLLGEWPALDVRALRVRKRGRADQPTDQSWDRLSIEWTGEELAGALGGGSSLLALVDAQREAVESLRGVRAPDGPVSARVFDAIQGARGSVVVLPAAAEVHDAPGRAGGIRLAGIRALPADAPDELVYEPSSS